MKTIKEIILDSSEKLRGHIEFEEYRNNILSAIFYKYLSYKIEKENNKQLFKYEINYYEAFNEENMEYYGKKIKKDYINKEKYFIHPNNLYKNIIIGKNKVEKLNNAIKSIELMDERYNDLLTIQTINTNSEMNDYYEKVLVDINEINFKKEEIDFLMKYFLKNSYTPQAISELLSKIVLTNNKKINTVYDATCGCCSTLLTLNKYKSISHFYGQEIKKDNYKLANMNMILNNIPLENFNLFNEDSTLSKRQLPQIDAILSHPPFLKKWDADKELLNYKRFNEYKKLPPKSKASYAFLESMIYQLGKEGIMAIVMPQGVLSRTNAEKEIRKALIEEKNYLDAVIGLPEKSFPKNSSTCIMILKKNRCSEDKILFIDSAKRYENNSLDEALTNENINEIVEVYKNRLEIEKYSHNTSMDEIRKNDYNLNIKRYVNTYDEKEKINIKDTLEEIELLEKEIIILNEKEKSLIEKLKIRKSGG